MIFCDNESFERVPPRHAGGNGNQGINFVWPKQAVIHQTKTKNDLVSQRVAVQQELS